MDTICTTPANQPSCDAEWTDKPGIAKRYGISVRKVDYLRAQKILPYYEFPSRCIRFNIRECDAAMQRYRRAGSDGDSSPTSHA